LGLCAVTTFLLLPRPSNDLERHLPLLPVFDGSRNVKEASEGSLLRLHHEAAGSSGAAPSPRSSACEKKVRIRPRRRHHSSFCRREMLIFDSSRAASRVLLKTHWGTVGEQGTFKVLVGKVGISLARIDAELSQAEPRAWTIRTYVFSSSLATRGRRRQAAPSLDEPPVWQCDIQGLGNGDDRSGTSGARTLAFGSPPPPPAHRM
jgi:hypothetical protein